jgi:hypothetical protein
MVATITEELAVGINPKIRRGVEIICELHGIKPSTYVRQLIVRDLIKEGIFERPTFQRFENSIPQTAAE